MIYDYEKERPKVFLPETQAMFLRIRDRAFALDGQAGCATLEKIISGCTGDSFTMIACVDRLVEIGELRKVPQQNVASQYEIYVWIGREGGGS